MEHETRRYSILIVDDDPMVCRLFEELCRRTGHDSASARNGAEALESMKARRFDMVISDIRMPVMDGFELFRHLETNAPGVKRVLMTGGDIDEYLSLVKRYNIGNILPKGGDFSAMEMMDYIGSLLTGNVFGLSKYFPRASVTMRTVRSCADTGRITQDIITSYPVKEAVFLEMAIDELISNAVFHGVLKMSGINREQWRADYQIEHGDSINVSWAVDAEKIGVCVEDPAGNLRKSDVLRWLNHGPEEELAEGEHGRGLLLIRKIIDRFIINIDPGKKTECIILQYKNRARIPRVKPILIHEL